MMSYKNVNVSVAEWLRRLCLQHGITVKTLPDFLGLPSSLVNWWMRGRCPRLEYVVLVETVFDLKRGEFYDVCKRAMQTGPSTEE